MGASFVQTYCETEREYAGRKLVGRVRKWKGYEDAGAAKEGAEEEEEAPCRYISLTSL
ncbi:hypothetical protein WH47_07377 [Habropoda laboriosa]|uniref:Uncharacterized protein n=1 Tax=Habropoda laboriosa TaxID=597456 RepID=A0A0L7R631_9HYME|nr:hypothetical protein WH47_07377 [Habropoda laboriosa]